MPVTNYINSGTFRILSPPTITVNTPSAGPYHVTDTINITWSTTNTVNNLKIDLYKFSTLVKTLSSSTANDGSFNYTIVTSDLAGTSNFYRIKIQETDGSPSDFSGYFTINNFQAKVLTEATSITENFSDTITQFKVIKTATDSTQFTDSIASSTQLWKYIKTETDATLFSESISSFVQSQPEPIDNISMTESLSTSKISWKFFKSLRDATAVTETVAIYIQQQPDVFDGTLFNESLSTSISQWQRIVADQSVFSENFDYNLGFNYRLSDNPQINESVVSTTEFWKHLYGPTESTLISEVLTSDIYVYKKLETISDTTQFSVDSLSHNVSTWENSIMSDATIYTEVISPDTRVWKHNVDSLDSTSTTETVVKETRVWKHLVVADDSTELTQSITTETKPWKRFATEETVTTESVQHTISQWAYVINEVLAFTERISDVFGEASIDGIAFVESINSQILRNCNIRKFQDNPTEDFSTLHKTGWIVTDNKEGKSRLIRRLNLEYNSADPIDVSIYVDGDDQNQEFNTSFAADTSEETTNKSVRVGRRAKNFMLQLSTPSSSNTNVTIEDIEIEIDDGKN